MHKLQDSVEQLLRSNEDLAGRLKGLEREGSVTTTRDQDDTSSIRTVRSLEDRLSKTTIGRSVGFAFEDELNSSRAYKKAVYRHSQASLTSSALFSTALSVFSNLSLAQVSNISMYALPIYSADIHNDEWYKFGENEVVLDTTVELPEIRIEGQQSQLSKDTFSHQTAKILSLKADSGVHIPDEATGERRDLIGEKGVKPLAKGSDQADEIKDSETVNIDDLFPDQLSNSPSIEDGDFDDLFPDQLSSSPSIEDEDIDFEFVYAMHTFLATVEGQINTLKGDILVLLDDTNSYWWLVRCVRDSGIGYLPAEQIETPTERLARLNKHRNLDLAVTRLSDYPGKPLNQMGKAMRDRQSKKVRFLAPRYIEPSSYGSDESETESNVSDLLTLNEQVARTSSCPTIR